MSISIKRSGNGFASLSKEIGRIRKFGPFLKEIGQSLEASTKLRFRDSEDPNGNEWKELSEAYLEQLRRDNRGRRKPIRPLVLSGRLQKSISYSADANEVNIGTDVEYAAKHQEGLDGLPKREFLGISQKDEEEIERIVQKHIEG